MLAKGFDLFGVAHFGPFDPHGTIKHGLGIVGVDALCIGVEGEEGIDVERCSVGTSKCSKRLYFSFLQVCLFDDIFVNGSINTFLFQV